MANLSPRLNVPQFRAAVDRPAEIREKGERKEINYQALTVMDWNSGASPLDAWLNSSAVPSTTAALDQQESMKPEIDHLVQEIEEMKVFRNVHIANAPSPDFRDPQLEHVEGVDLDSRSIIVIS